MDREFYRVSEIAPALGVTRGRVYQMIAAGELPGAEIAGAIRIPAREWERWLAEQNARARRVAEAR
jgi:excisionase family DNA binding protein